MSRYKVLNRIGNRIAIPLRTPNVGGWIRRSLKFIPERLVNFWRRRKMSATASDILSQYVSAPPNWVAGFDMFKGEWSSNVPGYGGGGANLFDDHRVKWIGDRCGGFAGKSVLELGPLECGHTYMMNRAGASVTAIEANTRAYLKCLIVKNAFGLSADIQLGDFRPFLRETGKHFDILMMSGVLYHMTDPVEFLGNCMRVSDSIGVWTHYFDPDVCLVRPDLKDKFNSRPHTAMLNGRTYTFHEQRYHQALGWAGFCGGSSPNSFWLTRDSLFSIFTDNGFDVELGGESKDHPNGPETLFLARRRR